MEKTAFSTFLKQPTYPFSSVTHCQKKHPVINRDTSDHLNQHLNYNLCITFRNLLFWKVYHCHNEQKIPAVQVDVQTLHYHNPGCPAVDQAINHVPLTALLLRTLLHVGYTLTLLTNSCSAADWQLHPSLATWTAAFRAVTFHVCGSG